MIITNLLNEIKEQVANNEISACLKIRINLQGKKKEKKHNALTYKILTKISELPSAFLCSPC